MNSTQCRCWFCFSFSHINADVCFQSILKLCMMHCTVAKLKGSNYFIFNLFTPKKEISSPLATILTFLTILELRIWGDIPLSDISSCHLYAWWHKPYDIVQRSSYLVTSQIEWVIRTGTIGVNWFEVKLLLGPLEVPIVIFTVCHIILMKIVWRIRHWINH